MPMATAFTGVCVYVCLSMCALLFLFGSFGFIFGILLLSGVVTGMNPHDQPIYTIHGNRRGFEVIRQKKEESER